VSNALTDNYIKHTSKSWVQQLLISNFNKRLLQLAKGVHPQAILDVGCGEGFTLQRLKGEGIGKKLEGIDYSKDAIALGKKTHPNIVIKHGDIYALPYKDNSFDLIICSEVMEHLQDPKKALTELARVTKKYCILSVPNEPIFMLGGIVRGTFPKTIGHINFWTRFGFKRFVEKKFRVVSIYNPFPWTLVLAEKLSS